MPFTPFSPMASETDVANVALAHLGHGDEIDSLATNTSVAARIIRRIYKDTLASILSAYNWNWARAFQRLQISSFWPTPEWSFAYQYPPDCVQIRRIYNFHHYDDRENIIEYVEANDGTQRLILSNFGPVALLPKDSYTPTKNTSNYPSTIDKTQIPIMEYTAFIENLAIMPPLFKEAFTYILAAKAAPLLSGVGQSNLRKECFELGSAALSQAAALDANASKLMPDKRSLIEKAAYGESVKVYNYTNLVVPPNYEL